MPKKLFDNNDLKNEFNDAREIINGTTNKTKCFCCGKPEQRTLIDFGFEVDERY